MTIALKSFSSSLVEPRRNDTVSSPTTPLLFHGSKYPTGVLSLRTRQSGRIGADAVKVHRSSPITATTHTFDVVIVGAGIIGLTIARQFLMESDLSVAVVDKDVPCSGATGAGILCLDPHSGYIWMANKTPTSEKWELAMRSHQLWRMLAHSIHDQGFSPLEVLGWKKTGSLLVGRTAEESVMLKRRVEQLSVAGLKAEYLSSHGLLLQEPEIKIGEEGGAAFLPDDCQLDARKTVTFIEKGWSMPQGVGSWILDLLINANIVNVQANRKFVGKGRYADFYCEPATCLLRSGDNGEVQGVQTSKTTLYCKKALVVAAGCWSGSLMDDLLRDSDVILDVPVKPRKGHLLVLENFKSLQLNHGLMEVGYVDHQQTGFTAAGSTGHEQSLSVSMTATLDAFGNLVLGSSRQFTGFNTEVDDSVIDSIWKRAAEFFPRLKEVSLRELIRRRKVRVGLRPYMPDGKPMIGRVPGFSNVFIATGHEGAGLSTALGTAEMVADMVLGNPGNINHAPFEVQGR